MRLKNYFANMSCKIRKNFRAIQKIYIYILFGYLIYTKQLIIPHIFISSIQVCIYRILKDKYIIGKKK